MSYLQLQWETKEQHILKCKIASDNEAVTWDSCDQNHNNELQKTVEKLMNTVKNFYFCSY